MTLYSFARVLCALLLVSLSSRAQAVLEIEITQGVEAALPIAIVPFELDPGTPAPPEDIAAIVEADLHSSGLFSPVAESEFPERPGSAEDINFQVWRNGGIETLVLGRVTATAEGRYDVQFQLFDTIYGQQLIGYNIPTTRTDLRAAAHKISDLIFEELTGLPGAFSTRIAYISTQTSEGGAERYVLQIADSDGYNPRTIFSSSQPLLSPAWSPNGDRIAYVSFEHERPEIYVQDLAGGRRTLVAGPTRLNSAPAFSPDGTRMALTRSENGNPDIYILDLTSNTLTRLTDYSSIDTEPVWMPDGQSLVFTSDRTGRPQLYRVSSSGGEPQRLTFEGNYNAAADVAPDGSQIAMVHNAGKGFRIAVQDLASGLVRVLTDGSLDESPSFAPNGSMIMYGTTQGGQGMLAAVSKDGQVRQRLRLQEGDVREPVWGPFRGEP
jgi:TolB protein